MADIDLLVRPDDRASRARDRFGPSAIGRRAKRRTSSACRGALPSSCATGRGSICTGMPPTICASKGSWTSTTRGSGVEPARSSRTERAGASSSRPRTAPAPRPAPHARLGLRARALVRRHRRGRPPLRARARLGAPGERRPTAGASEPSPAGRSASWPGRSIRRCRPACWSGCGQGRLRRAAVARCIGASTPPSLGGGLADTRVYPAQTLLMDRAVRRASGVRRGPSFPRRRGSGTTTRSIPGRCRCTARCIRCGCAGWPPASSADQARRRTIHQRASRRSVTTSPASAISASASPLVLKRWMYRYAVGVRSRAWPR